MKCYKCGKELLEGNSCPSCGAKVGLYRKIIASSNFLYNRGLEAANERNLTDAGKYLKGSLRLNKNQIDARNLLGLIYYERGEVTQALEEWSISRALRPSGNEAERYLQMLTGGLSREDTASIIRKYNTSVGYVKQSNYDIAMVQLKNILSLHPHFVKAHQMLALLYCIEDDYVNAKTEIEEALRQRELAIDNREQAQEELILLGRRSKALLDDEDDELTPRKERRLPNIDF